LDRGLIVFLARRRDRHLEDLACGRVSITRSDGGERILQLTAIEENPVAATAVVHVNVPQHGLRQFSHARRAGDQLGRWGGRGSRRLREKATQAVYLALRHPRGPGDLAAVQPQSSASWTQIDLEPLEDRPVQHGSALHARQVGRFRHAANLSSSRAARSRPPHPQPRGGPGSPPSRCVLSLA
jgi:hypothetical protein